MQYIRTIFTHYSYIEDINIYIVHYLPSTANKQIHHFIINELECVNEWIAEQPTCVYAGFMHQYK